MEVKGRGPRNSEEEAEPGVISSQHQGIRFARAAEVAAQDSHSSPALSRTSTAQLAATARASSRNQQHKHERGTLGRWSTTAVELRRCNSRRQRCTPPQLPPGRQQSHRTCCQQRLALAKRLRQGRRCRFLCCSPAEGQHPNHAWLLLTAGDLPLLYKSTGPS